jgi:hypothetical protein
LDIRRCPGMYTLAGSASGPTDGMSCMDKG